VAAPHRAAAFEACRFVIEEVKRRLTIWKKELRADGTTVWVDTLGKAPA
jgi:molybdopterin synthase catalytic subunit